MGRRRTRACGAGAWACSAGSPGADVPRDAASDRRGGTLARSRSITTRQHIAADSLACGHINASSRKGATPDLHVTAFARGAAHVDRKESLVGCPVHLHVIHHHRLVPNGAGANPQRLPSRNLERRAEVVGWDRASLRKHERAGARASALAFSAVTRQRICQRT